MRLTPQQIDIIRHAAEEAFGPGTQIVLFGSRVDNNRRGGDIALLVQPANPDQALARKIRFLGILERRLGERKIDVIIESPRDTRPIVQIARATGVRL